MMSKLPRASPRMKGLRLNSQSPELSNKINIKDLAEPKTQANEGEITSKSITGTNLQSYDWVRERAGNATFSNMSRTSDKKDSAKPTVIPGEQLMREASYTTSSEEEINKIPFSKKTEADGNKNKKSKERVMNQEIIKKCMRYVAKCEREDIARDHDINISTEDYLSERRNYFFELLDEIHTYPPQLQKTILNYKINYDDEQEMFSREIIQLYKTGATDPRFMLSKLMKEAVENPSSDSDDDGNGAKAALRNRFKPPNLTCFKKKDSTQIDYAN